MAFTIKINGADHPVDVDGDTDLLCLLRDVLGMTGVRENRRWCNATARAANDFELEIIIPTEFFDQIAGSPRVARELQRRPHENWQDAGSQTVESAVNNAYLTAKNLWFQPQFHTPFGLGDVPFVVGRRPVAGEEQPPYQPDLKLDDTTPFRLSRNHSLSRSVREVIVCATSAAHLERDTMRLDEILRPVPGAGEVLVAVKAAGVGPWDRLVREGRSGLGQALPLTLGADVIAKESGASVYGTARVRDVERGMLNLPIGDVLDLADASTAHRMLDGAPHKPGKIVLRVAD